MEDFTYSTYAVIDNSNEVIGILNDFNDAFRLAKKYNASCIETLDDCGTILNTFWITDEADKMKKQKTLSLIGILLSIISVFATGGDATFAVVMIPCMIALFFSKEYWITE